MSHFTYMKEWCLMYETVMSHIWMSHVTHLNESSHTHEWVMSHISMSHVTHMNESCRTFEWVTSHIWVSHVTHMNESCHTYEWVMSHIWMSHVTHVWIQQGNQLKKANTHFLRAGLHASVWHVFVTTIVRGKYMYSSWHSYEMLFVENMCLEKSINLVRDNPGVRDKFVVSHLTKAINNTRNVFVTNTTHSIFVTHYRFVTN